ncbi:MAG: Fis family transcriptional regulator, partial [Deltaproteobacteria bacterium HGW-Deltaproteobacteria-17]
RMPRMTGLEFLREARRVRPQALPIILTAYRDVDVLVEAIRLGHIYRFVTKPWNAEELKSVIQQVQEIYHLREENERLEAKLRAYAGYLDERSHQDFNFGNIVGDSEGLARVLHQIERVAPTSSTVLIRGETGTGKELVAHAIHLNSPRCDGPFVKVNCAALSPGVLESELFGHEKGAFTGAVARRMGRFELADGGSLFLDEVGDIPPEVQVKLLRVLQEREFERVGGEETIKVDVRVISATHRNLEALVSSAGFRQDLYYRLNVFPIELPPLRERPGDIPLLLQHFISRFSPITGKHILRIEDTFMEQLLGYHWPGNVRELENLVERAMVLSSDGVLTGDDLQFNPAIPQEGTAQITPPPVMEPRPLTGLLQDEEKKGILKAIEASSGNMAAAARLLGMNRSTLYYRLKKHDLLHLLPYKWSRGPEEEAP